MSRTVILTAVVDLVVVVTTVHPLSKVLVLQVMRVVMQFMKELRAVLVMVLDPDMAVVVAAVPAVQEEVPLLVEVLEDLVGTSMNP